ncbi:MAG: hypothetical protein WC593_12860 [Methanoregula sp.]
MNNLTPQQKIVKMNLELNAQSTFYTVEAILIAFLGFFIVSTAGLLELYGTSIIIILMIGMILKQYFTNKTIDSLFME